VYTAAAALHVLEWIAPPPARYPDLFPVLNVLISTPVFMLIWLWSIKCSVEVAWALGGLTGSGNTEGVPSIQTTGISPSASSTPFLQSPSEESPILERLTTGNLDRLNQGAESVGRARGRGRGRSGSGGAFVFPPSLGNRGGTPEGKVRRRRAGELGGGEGEEGL